MEIPLNCRNPLFELHAIGFMIAVSAYNSWLPHVTFYDMRLDKLMLIISLVNFTDYIPLSLQVTLSLGFIIMTHCILCSYF